jgi:hypothetical protein
VLIDEKKNRGRKYRDTVLLRTLFITDLYGSNALDCPFPLFEDQKHLPRVNFLVWRILNQELIVLTAMLFLNLILVQGVVAHIMIINFWLVT